ncbi:hypothetical protein B0H16DRAFT_1859545 [Mycena metata]|uniref:GST N-terminal domain-containing protein n=1 Tax=Mycena metata TaxID=1033252 RepID=A0AAD7II20_9AGAR|nr:hypothetical protein B0H16DRAFT_1859545 [Mycena metata]
MDPSKPILFYDIASGPPVTTYSPNPWKTRYARNFKGVHYTTERIDHPQVTAVRKKLDCPPVRWHRDGTPFYTLPIIHYPSTGKMVGDSFEIARYLDAEYPNGPRLIPPSTTALHRAFNIHVDKISPTSKAEFDDLTLRGDVRTKQLAEFKEALGVLATFYVDEEAPFLEDMIVGAWLQFLKASLAEWKESFEVLNQYAEVK